MACLSCYNIRDGRGQHAGRKIADACIVQSFFLCDRKFLSHKTLREDRTAADKKCVAEATRRRRRILRAGFFLFI